jgi:hypothetical protein
MTAYEYRVDMTQAIVAGDASCVTDLSVDFGPNAQLNYDGSGNSDAYVITQGGIGTVGVLYATRSGNTLNFTFSQPVCAGATAGSGQSSQFIGVASAQAPVATTATVGWPGLLGLSVPARAPAH